MSWRLNQSEHSIHSSFGQVQNPAAAFERAESVHFLRPTSPFKRPPSPSSRRPKSSVGFPHKRSLSVERLSMRGTPRHGDPAGCFDESGVWVSDSTLNREVSLEDIGGVALPGCECGKYGHVVCHCCTCVQLDHIPVRDSEEMYYSHQSLSPGHGSPKRVGLYNGDSSINVFPDNDSGFSSSMNMLSRSGMLMSDEFNSPPNNMSRSKSLSRVNLDTSNEFTAPSMPSVHRYRPFDRSLKHLHNNLEDSENRRVVLMHKLKEAQGTLELQSERLAKIENTAKGNTFLVDDLRLKEKEYRQKIAFLEHSQDERDILKLENLRLREEMQDRIDKLDFQLRSLTAQHQVAENENMKRSNLLEQSTTALSLLEQENTKLQKDKETLRGEILVAKEAMEMARHKFGPMEEENRSLREDLVKLKQENDNLTKKVHELTGQLMELRSLTETMKDENDRLATSWKTLTEDKQRTNRQLENQQESLQETKSRVSSLGAERDRLFQDKMELSNKVQQLLLDKEQVEKSRISAEEQLVEHEQALERAKKVGKRKDEERRKAEEELQEMKRANDDMTKELATTKAYYERALEQISVLENNKQLATQQQELMEHEKKRLYAEVDRLKEAADGRSKDLKREREQLEEAVLDLKAETRQARAEKTRLEDKCQELEIKLQRANDDIRETTSLKQGEIDTLRSTCDRLSAGVSKKENELQDMTDQIQVLEEQTARYKEEIRTYKDECEQLLEHQEDTKRLKDENRKLLQEKAENEQMIKLLETQKEVLTKSTESSLAKLHDVEKLTEKMEHYKNENELLRDRINELEKVRDSLIKQKEELLANSELIYKKPQLEELESKIEELRGANKQLRDINEQINERCETLNQPVVESQIIPTLSEPVENVTLKDAIGGDGSVVPRVELERLAKEKERLQEDLEHLRQDHENLEERHQRFIINYGHEESEAKKDKEDVEQLKREKEALEKQVALINGQMLLVEGSKKRLDEVVDDLQKEIVQLRQQLEEAEKRHSAQFTPEMNELQEQIDILNEHLDDSKYEQEKQNQLIKSLKEELDEERTKKPTQIRESLDDVGSELNEMREELQKLMSVIESKDQAIVTLENQLRTSKDEVKFRDKAVTDLKSIVTDLESKNEELRLSLDGIRASFEEQSSSPSTSLSPRSPRSPRGIMKETPAKSSFPSHSTPRRNRSSSPEKASRIPRRLDDSKSSEGLDSDLDSSTGKDKGGEIFKRVKPIQEYLQVRSKKQPQGGAGKHRQSRIPQRDDMTIPGQYGSKFISKQQVKRSQSEKGSDRLQSLISKYRTYSDHGSQVPERKIKPLSLSSSSKMGLVTRGRSFGPSAPKSDSQVSPTASGTEEVGLEGEVIPTAPMEVPEVVISPESVAVAQSSPSLHDVAVGGDRVSEGEAGETEGTEDDDEDDDTDGEDDDNEQKDINALIDRHASHPKPILSVSPPKITSTSKSLKCKKTDGVSAPPDSPDAGLSPLQHH